MNDFTKEELIYLKDGLALLEQCGMTKLLKNKIENLWVKTSKMIDNYCEHEFICYACITSDSIDCIKCEKKINE